MPRIRFLRYGSGRTKPAHFAQVPLCCVYTLIVFANASKQAPYFSVLATLARTSGRRPLVIGPRTRLPQLIRNIANLFKQIGNLSRACTLLSLDRSRAIWL